MQGHPVADAGPAVPDVLRRRAPAIHRTRRRSSWLKKDLYKGKFDQGWDKVREEILERQIKMGIVPPGTKLAANPESVQKWDTLSADEKTVFARQMEVYATLTEHADYEVGRLVDGHRGARASWTTR